MKKLQQFIEHNWFQNFIIMIIIANSITIGLETVQGNSALYYKILQLIDHAAISIFVIELTLRIMCYRLSFFTKSWNIFDAIIIGVSVIPASNYASVMRALRIIRALRLLSVVPAMRRVVSALVYAMSGMLASAVIMVLVFYIGSVMCTKLFGAEFATWFGTIGESAYTLFQIMTLESWSMGIVRPVMKVFPYAWVFFVPFVVISTFVLLNFIIGVLVDAILAMKTQEIEGSGAMTLDKLAEKIDLLESKLDEISDKE
jgi:voltage-gated sodium channel